MRIPALLFALVLCIGALLALAVFVAPPAAQVVPHPDHPSLLQGAPGAARVAPVWWLGAAFGALQIAFFGACFALGLRRGGSLGPLATGIGVGLGLYLAVYAALLVAYRAYLLDPEPALLLSFPTPTAVMLFGLWPVPLWFVWLYLRHFDDWVLREEDLERVRRLARERESS